MNQHSFEFSLLLGALAVVMAVIHGAIGLRARASDAEASRLHFIIASVAIVIAVLVFLRGVSPIAGYALLCLTLAAFQLFDLLQDERARARMRRAASLAPRPAAEIVPTIWVAIALASVSMLVPYVVLGQERAAALLVGVCAIVMAWVSWRIASAPVQLFGDDIRSERMRDRVWRSRKAGVTAVVAIGSIFAFISFANSGLPAVEPWQRLLLQASFFTWAVLGAWVVLYSYILGRLTRPASS